MTTCPSCGIAGNNFSCPNHSYWGINPLPDSIPTPKQSPIDLSPYIDEEKKWLFAETGRLHLSLSKANKEIEWLRGERPATVAWLRQTSERMNDATLAHAADCIEDGEHRVEEAK